MTKIYKCKECNFKYKTKKLAQQCEKWCKEHKSCNIEITKHAIGFFFSKKKSYNVKLETGSFRKKSLKAI